MDIGFTGTRRGMSAAQVLTLWRLLDRPRRRTFHHGDCIGADSEAHDVAVAYGYRIHIHPPIDAKYRAGRYANEYSEPLDYLARDRAIVDSVSLLIAAPAGPEIRRSGTWVTVRYARALAVELVVIMPDGSVL
jgi:hypothetical protein